MTRPTRNRTRQNRAVAIEPPIADEIRKLNVAEKAAVRRASRRVLDSVKTPTYQYNLESDGQTYISPQGDRRIQDYLQMDLFATGNEKFKRAMESDLAHAFRGEDGLCPSELEGALSIVRAVRPRDESEALLAVQMAAIHNAIIIAAGQLRRAHLLEHQDSAGKILSKLARTSCLQLQTLKKLRSTGEQIVHVQHQHVTVNDGGQAIVAGQMAPGEGENKNQKGQPHEPFESGERSPEVLSKIETQQAPMQGAGRPRLDRVPLSRRSRRRA